MLPGKDQTNTLLVYIEVIDQEHFLACVGDGFYNYNPKYPQNCKLDVFYIYQIGFECCSKYSTRLFLANYGIKLIKRMPRYFDAMKYVTIRDFLLQLTYFLSLSCLISWHQLLFNVSFQV